MSVTSDCICDFFSLYVLYLLYIVHVDNSSRLIVHVHIFAQSHIRRENIRIVSMSNCVEVSQERVRAIFTMSEETQIHSNIQRLVQAVLEGGIVITSASGTKLKAKVASSLQHAYLLLCQQVLTHWLIYGYSIIKITPDDCIAVRPVALNPLFHHLKFKLNKHGQHVYAVTGGANDLDIESTIVTAVAPPLRVDGTFEAGHGILTSAVSKLVPSHTLFCAMQEAVYRRTLEHQRAFIILQEHPVRPECDDVPGSVDDPSHTAPYTSAFSNSNGSIFSPSAHHGPNGRDTDFSTVHGCVTQHVHRSQPQTGRSRSFNPRVRPKRPTCSMRQCCSAHYKELDTGPPISVHANPEIPHDVCIVSSNHSCTHRLDRLIDPEWAKLIQQRYEADINQVLWWQSTIQHSNNTSNHVIHYWRTKLVSVINELLIQAYTICDHLIEASQCNPLHTPLDLTFQFQAHSPVK